MGRWGTKRGGREMGGACWETLGQQGVISALIGNRHPHISTP